jgi:CO/xanthine dehydrogenase Mo-binding subunit
MFPDSSFAVGGSPTLTRRSFVKAGGALFVSLSMPGGLSAKTAENNTAAEQNQLDAGKLTSWLEIRNDNTILARTGRAEIGTGMSGLYPQMIAEELRVRPDCITLVMGDTDKTPDGGYSAGFLSGATNLRKVAAYTYQALLGLAAIELGIPASALTVTDGIVSGGGKTIRYGQLVQNQQLDLKIPVTGTSPRFPPAGGNGPAGLGWEGMDGLKVEGDPPLKPASEYKVIGTSYPMPGTRDKVTGQTQWSCDVTLPGMLHARMVRPATLGSTLISVGEVDKKRFPTAEVVRKGNLVAVVSPDEWEAVSALRSVAAGTKWSAWSGLPGSENLTQTIRTHKWGAPDETKGDAAKVQAALGKASQTISATYEQPYVKHAPMGPFLAVADVRRDGSASIWAQAGHLQASRARLANILGTPAEKVVVHFRDHAGQFGRKTFGGDGAEADAVILSQMTGKPVRVQWTLQEDLAWSGASPAWFSDIKGGLDNAGCLTAVHSQFYSPHMFDARPLGAILAGMPAGIERPGGFLATEWPYDKIENRLEQVYAMPNVGTDSPSGGLRGLIMRTPGQRQQNFALESLINEAAAAAQTDPIQFRLNHTTDPRLIDILQATSKAAGWTPRPSPHAGARRSGNDPVTGRGVCIMVRQNGYWAGIAEITVIPATGVVQVTKFTIGVECGKIINPRQLDRCMRGGLVMGLGEALKEEVTFDKEKVTSTDWRRYQILTMAEMPEIQVVQLSRDDKGYAAGGEAPNAMAPPAVAAAFFDATGVAPRRIPLTPEYVTTLLKA